MGAHGHRKAMGATPWTPVIDQWEQLLHDVASRPGTPAPLVGPRAGSRRFHRVPSHRFLEHTGESRLLVTGASLEEVFEEAARALADPRRGRERAADQTGRANLADRADQETLLVDWLNELVYRGEVDKRVYGQVDVDTSTNGTSKRRSGDASLELRVRQ